MADKLSEPIETRLFINNEFRESSSNKTFDVVYPYTREVIATVHEADEKDVNDAVAAAKAAFPAWRDLGVDQRGEYLRKVADLFEKHTEQLGRLETLSIGRPISLFPDCRIAKDQFRYFADAGWQVQGTATTNTPGFLGMTVKEPYGPVACITPWNFPLLGLATKLAPALAAGNTVVLKSSEKAPLTSLYAAKLFVEAGFPPGVVNIISGHGNLAGAALSSHMDIRALSFTGSSLTGQKIQEAAAKSNLKHLHMELGGKTPAVIFEDADLEAAATQTKFSIQLNSGQICTANSRIYVHESVAERFTELFREKFAAQTIGDPFDPKTTHGPQVDILQHNRIKGYLDIAEKEGRVTLGGDASDGLFVKPTILQDMPEDSRVMREEVFGPVVAINTFKTEAEVIEKANATEYGLFASVFTKDIERGLRLAKALEAGTVSINCASPTHLKDASVGGYKMSGTGREGLLYSMENFVQTKTIQIKTAQ
ncbi:hypothetical protein N7492_002726 [Penicillium capsulatum]|uniref:aldehyde dehydrogenase (NAD(+)) n=1 Tax=Penicillium capsulatum TaxID=69766 RepID=A0A9W9LVH0_9EURO|nr:hypothetical protein N7492_002726 [Penicillium capsulatum]KAJ6122677.1 hypothetical protein N7512_005142 [Penicillium capsulatum]